MIAGKREIYQLAIKIIWYEHSFDIQSDVFGLWIHYLLITKRRHAWNIKNTPEFHLTLLIEKIKLLAIHNVCECKCFTELFNEFAYLSCEVSVGKRVQKLIECLLIELIVFGVLNFLWISHLHGGNRNQLSVLFISPYSLQSDHKYQKGDVLSMKQTDNCNSRLTHMGFVSLASSQSQYFSVIVFFFFSPYMSKYA